MKIGIDVSMITPSKAGIGYFAYSIVSNLSENDISNEYILYTNNKHNLERMKLNKNFSIVEFFSVSPNLKWMWKVYRHFKQEKVDAFLSMSNLFFGIISSNTLTVIHDLSQLKYPQFFTRKSSILYRIEFEILIRRAKFIVTVSESIRDEIIEFNKSTKNKVYNISEGLHDWAFEKNDERKNIYVKDKYKLPEKYFLSVSTLEPRKNYIGSIKAFAKFSKNNPDWYYLIAGKKGWFYDEIFNTVKNLELEGKVIFLGYIQEEDLSSLYDQALGFIYLSFYEGFGLPLLEAYSRKIPILASNIPVFKEFMLGKALFVNPSDINAISKYMEELKNISINKFDRKLLDSFSWRNTINKLSHLFGMLKKY